MKSVIVGEIFEKLFYRAVTSLGMACVRIPNGCKTVGRNKLIRVKTPADYMVVSKGRFAMIDTKTQGSGQTFPKANINSNQVFSMLYMKQHGAWGGYVCHFRDIDKVVFFDAEVLRLADEGLHWEDGLYLGPIEDMNLERIYEC